MSCVMLGHRSYASPTQHLTLVSASVAGRVKRKAPPPPSTMAKAVRADSFFGRAAFCLLFRIAVLTPDGLCDGLGPD